MNKFWHWLCPTHTAKENQVPVSDESITNDLKEENPVFNLIFHFHCINHEKLYYAIAKIEEHLSIFNGHKIFTISAPNDKFDNNPIFELLLKKFTNKNIYLIPVSNNNVSREAMHFFNKACPLLASLLKINKQKRGYTFYGHSKGCTHSEKNYAITCWVNTLFKYNLDLFNDKIKPQLLTNQYKFVGCLKTSTNSSLGADFHYAGTFFWFDTSLLEKNFLKSYDHKLGLEMWPGLVAKTEECYSVFDVDIINPYRLDMWYNLVYAGQVDVPMVFIPNNMR